MTTCTAWEVEEFIEQMILRPGLWFGKGYLWVRKVEGQNHLAVKFVDGLPNNMYTVHVKALTCDQTDAETYVCGLLERFTSYGERKKIEEYLRRSLIAECDTSRIEDMAREIAQLSLGAVKDNRLGLEPITRERRVSPMEGAYPRGIPVPVIPVPLTGHVAREAAEAKAAAAKPTIAPAPPKPQRSRYLRNLLK